MRSRTTRLARQPVAPPGRSARRSRGPRAPERPRSRPIATSSGSVDGGREADDAVVAGVDLQEERRRRADRARGSRRRACGSSCPTSRSRAPLFAITSGMRKLPPISTSSPRDTTHLASGGQRVQRQEHGGRVVVDDERGLGAGERAQVVGDERVAVAAPAGGEVELEVDGAARGRDDRRRSPPRRAARGRGWCAGRRPVALTTRAEPRRGGAVEARGDRAPARTVVGGHGAPPVVEPPRSVVAGPPRTASTTCSRRQRASSAAPPRAPASRRSTDGMRAAAGRDGVGHGAHRAPAAGRRHKQRPCRGACVRAADVLCLPAMRALVCDVSVPRQVVSSAPRADRQALLPRARSRPPR